MLPTCRGSRQLRLASRSGLPKKFTAMLDKNVYPHFGPQDFDDWVQRLVVRNDILS